MSSNFLELFQPHSQDLHKFLIRKIGCAATAADLLQETWIRILKLDRHIPIENPRSLLFRIAVNLVIDHQRKLAREAKHFSENGLQEDLPDRAPSLETVIFSRQQLAALQAAVAELPAKCRAVFLMVKRDHRTHAEVAAALGIAESTVVKHMVKALAFLKSRIEQGERF